mmetsp:Transcript_15970/g.40115  ORF Transcript_15970/g.40115 Transcript_15970/m.40115 type:complete len:116 (+) Transcript_15970:477-824(+)
MMPQPEAPVEEEKGAEHFAPEKIQQNARTISTCRIASAIVAGCVAGIMGMEGLSGFLLFFVSCLVTSCMLCVRTGSVTMVDFFAKPNQVWTQGLTEGLMSYILFWTMLFDLVHIF